MSYILNALRKSDRERQAKQQVTNRIFEQEPERRQSMFRWIAVIVIVNLIAIACLFWYVTKPTENTATTETPKRPPASIVSEQRSSDLLTRAEEPRPELSLERKTTPISELTNANVPPKPGTPVKHKPEKQPNDASRPVQTVQEQKPLTVAKAPVEITPVPEPFVAPRPVAVVPLEPKPDRASDIPWLREMPFEFRQTVPKMNINVFVYASDPSERFVLIDMVKYKPGQDTKDGVGIVEIKQDGLVVRYDGRIFKVERP